MATSESATHQLRWPSADEVRLNTDVINPLGGVDKMPTFLAERRGIKGDHNVRDLWRQQLSTACSRSVLQSSESSVLESVGSGRPERCTYNKHAVHVLRSIESTKGTRAMHLHSHI